ncbi:hypothetical protein CHELA41_51734 [Hyphomicrobiales bacterium]|nr:hypothetical protein CHELA41_51734 [Hyphomicrobiales bacterium]
MQWEMPPAVARSPRHPCAPSADTLARHADSRAGEEMRELWAIGSDNERTPPSLQLRINDVHIHASRNIYGGWPIPFSRRFAAPMSSNA